MIPGWPYSLVTACRPGVVRGPRRWMPAGWRRATTADSVKGGHLREMVRRLMTAGQWCPGDADIRIVADADYDGPRLAFLLAGLPVRLLARMRSDRVLRRRAPLERAARASHQPATITQTTLAAPDAIPAPSLVTRVRPNGHRE